MVKTDREIVLEKKQSGFICAAWVKRVQGPMHGYTEDTRAVYVLRCDLPEGHEGRHCDQVLLVDFDGETPDQIAEAAATRIRKEGNQ